MLILEQSQLRVFLQRFIALPGQFRLAQAEPLQIGTIKIFLSSTCPHPGKQVKETAQQQQAGTGEDERCHESCSAFSRRVRNRTCSCVLRAAVPDTVAVERVRRVSSSTTIPAINSKTGASQSTSVAPPKRGR